MKHLKFLIFLIIVILVLPLLPQEEIREEVKIRWWVVPLFAVDKLGNSVVDLKPEDISLRINNQRVTGFSLYKRNFSVAEKVVDKGEEAPPVEKGKIVFLLFDLAYTTSTNYEMSKSVAKSVVMKAEENTLFSIIAIDPLIGPQYIGGPLKNKQQVTKLIDEKITWDPETKSIANVIFLVNSTQYSDDGSVDKKGGAKPARLEGLDLETLTAQRGSGLRNANLQFIQAFHTLYQALNSIKDNKFVYLFSEGISLFSRSVVSHGSEEYWHFMKQTADFLSKSGAVLFIINPAGARVSSRSMASGEDSLRYLARQSGGKYMEGEKEYMTTRIENMHRAYYEIAFPDHEAFGGEINRIVIRSRRSGVSVHTLNHLEKSKQYSEMSSAEREVLVLNMLNPSPLFKSPLSIKTLKIDKTTEKKDDILHKIDLPGDFSDKSIDVYKIWVNEKTYEASVEKESLVTGGKLNLTLKRKEGIAPRLVLVNGKDSKALVQGIFDAQEEKKTILEGSAATFMEKVKDMNQKEIKELERIKVGAANYCTRLGEAAFHYICKETVSEVLEVIRMHKELREAKLDEITGTYRAGYRAQDDRRAVKRKLTNKYTNDYQLISNKGRVKEQRNLIKGSVKKIEGKDDLLRIDNFITRKISLSPLTLLALDSQDKFYYRFVKHEKVKGVPTAVIECFPKDTSNIKSNYGKIWVDLEDFSVIRMSLNPVSIGGYANLLKLARYYKSKLILTCELNFYLKRNGIRFPTQVLIRETYSGGSVLRTVVNKNVWERSKTTYDFDDYRFFDVTTTSKEEELKK